MKQHAVLSSTRKLVRLNFLTAGSVVFIWMLYSMHRGLPTEQEFLGFRGTDGSASIGVGVVDALLVVHMFRRPPEAAVRFLRALALLVGTLGIGLCSLPGPWLPGEPPSATERAIGLYVWASHVAIALSWPAGGRSNQNASN